MQISIHAFATLEEIAEWLAPFTQKMQLYFALEVYSPKRQVVPLARWDKFVDKARTLGTNRLWIDFVPIPRMQRKTTAEYNTRDTREQFSIDLPEHTKFGLREGWFGAVATKDKRLKVWRSMIRVIRKNTTGGMWFWNERLKAKEFWDRSRYSPKIAELHAKGLRLLPFFGGDSEVFVHEPRRAMRPPDNQPSQRARRASGATGPR